MAYKKQVAMIAYWSAIVVGLANRYQFRSNKTMIEESLSLQNVPLKYKENISEMMNTIDLNRKVIGALWESVVTWSNEMGINLVDNQLTSI